MFVLTFASRLPVAKSHYWRDGGKPSGGRQSEPREGEPLAYGKSITDACIGWDDTMLCYVNWRMQ